MFRLELPVIALGCVAAAYAPVTGIAVLVALFAGAWLFGRIDVWRVLAMLLLLALAASSVSESVAAPPAVFRFVMLGVLTGWVALYPANHADNRALRTVGVRRACFAAAVFLGWAVSSIAWSSAPIHTASQVAVFGLTAACVYLTATRRWTTHRRLIGDLKTLLCVLVPLSAVSLVGALAHLSFAYGYGDRYQGVFTSANTTGMVAALSLPLAWGLKGTSRRKWPYWLAILLSGATLVVSGSRGSIVAVAGAAAWMAWRGGSGRILRAAVAVVVIASGAFFVQSTVERETPLTGAIERFLPSEGEDYSTSRLTAWKRTIDLWQEKPVIGHGFRGTERLFAAERETGDFQFRPDTAHNGFLQVLLELGVVGLAIFLVAIARVVRVGAQGRTPHQIGLFGSVLVGLLLQFTESPIFGTGSLFPFVFWSLVAATAVAGADREHGARPARERRSVLLR